MGFNYTLYYFCCSKCNACIIVYERYEERYKKREYMENTKNDIVKNEKREYTIENVLFYI